ncbi:MAG: GntR family transcriptional regulator [Solirubrobacteraceae bacterium]
MAARTWKPPALDRSGPVPLYYQLQDVLHQQMAAGRWSPGTPLPSESELCRLFGVSRHVVREALTILEDDGEVVRRHGAGTFVAPPKPDHLAGGLLRVVRSLRRTRHAIEIVAHSDAEVDEALSTRLGSADVLRVDWRLLLEGSPIAVAYSFLDARRVPDFAAAARQGTVDASHVRSLQLAPAELTVETSSCSPYMAELLEVPARSAVFLLTAVEREQGEDAPPLEIARLIYRSDKLSLRLELSERDGVQQITLRVSGFSSERAAAAIS